MSTTLLRKEKAGNTILRADSAHPYSLIKSILFSEYLRLTVPCQSNLKEKLTAWEIAGQSL